MTLAVEDANSKLFGVVDFVDADFEESVDDRLMRADSLATASHVWQQHRQQLFGFYRLPTVSNIFCQHLGLTFCILFKGRYFVKSTELSGQLCVWQCLLLFQYSV